MTANPLSTIPPIGPTTGMTAPPSPGRFKPIDPVILLRRHFKILLSVGIVSAALGGGLYYLLLKKAPQFTSEAQILVENIQVSNVWTPGSGSGGGSSDAISNMINNEVNLITSDSVIRDALNRPEILRTSWYKGFKTASQAREAMQTDLFRASMIRGTTLMGLTMNAKVKSEATVLLEGVIATYLNLKQLQNQTASSGLRKVFLDMRDQAEDDMLSIQRARERFIE